MLSAWLVKSSAHAIPLLHPTTHRAESPALLAVGKRRDGTEHDVRREESQPPIDIAAVPRLVRTPNKLRQVGGRSLLSHRPVPQRGVRRQHGPRRCPSERSHARSRRPPIRRSTPPFL